MVDFSHQKDVLSLCHYSTPRKFIVPPLWYDIEDCVGGIGYLTTKIGAYNGKDQIFLLELTHYDVTVTGLFTIAIKSSYNRCTKNCMFLFPEKFQILSITEIINP